MKGNIRLASYWYHSINEGFENAQITNESVRKLLRDTLLYHLKCEMAYLNHNNFLKNIEFITNLSNEEGTIALRLLRAHFERKIWAEIPDELFYAIVNKLPFLSPLHPLGPYSIWGYTRPLSTIFREFGWTNKYVMSTYKFFKYAIHHI